MKIKFRFDIADRIFVFVFVIVVLTLFTAYAYGTNNPASFGHSGGEIEVSCAGLGISNASSCFAKRVVSPVFTVSCNPSGGTGCSSFFPRPVSLGGSTDSWDICYLTGYSFSIDDDGGAGAGDDSGSCRIFRDTSGNWSITASYIGGALGATGNVSCSGRCIRI